MKATLFIVVLGFCLVGCKPPVEPTSNNTAPPFGLNKSAAGSSSTTGTSTVTGTTGSNGGVAPMASGAAGGMTPMTGTDSVEGAGAGSLGQSAKNLAKDKANKMSSGSLDQGGKDESGQ
jgi:hypothetical protein